MKFLQLATLIGAALALPSDPDPLSPRQTCTSPKLRKSWSKATSAEKTAYLHAAVCVTTKSSRLKNNANATLHDDFAYVHALLSSPQKIHDFAGFLPWHRFFVQVYEKALQECGYPGTAMYWDWVADSPAPSKAKVWDSVTGFGGNGVSTGDNGPRLRVIDGPFKDFRPLYWNTDVSPHWLSRDWLPAQNGEPEISGANYSPARMAEVNAQTTFDGFRQALESGPHAAVHGGVGGGGRGLGDLGFQNASPNDPLFFLHHTQVDRLWWLWQQQDPQTRTFAYNGFHNTQDGSQGPTVMLSDILPMAGLAPDGIVKDYMDVKGGKLCYTY
ncbi:hypothetical protein B0T25DRAFT_31797 [Lasiosphaeria hispida]|uniref:Tyrosinase copper-binding domain-containing protein n=1 Tax=Lasiosphaeria hispida TaxID=260671 RepID=A0AAJ0MJU7_9PEZI|nr:hypothetical protein B0T25DRAFT_31797 [Lasiosphaeria hispida]